MKKLSIKGSNLPVDATINLVSSKSESNRALIINALAGFSGELKNLSAARDTQTMKSLLNSGEMVANVIDAGTTMRFLASYFAVLGFHKILTGTPRMCERPIGILVEALRKLGANIEYEAVEGFPPLKIEDFEYSGAETLEMRGDVSSQFISSIMMIANKLPNGLTIQLTGEVGSKPYIEMTAAQMRMFGANVTCNWQNNQIIITNSPYHASTFAVESDWSGASYWFSVVALAHNAQLKVLGLNQNSLQGDSAIVGIMNRLGVFTCFNEEGIVLTKIESHAEVEIDFTNCPDLCQTIAVVCAAKGIKATFIGIESLKVKETDRVLALQKELAKIGTTLVEIESNHKYLLTPGAWEQSKPTEFDTYDDHRMAMAFAPLGLLQPIIIDNPDVVAKSYPSFWEDFRKVASIKEL